MSLHEELRSARRCLDDLARHVARLEQRLGDDLEIRRVRSDTEHLRESLSLLSAAAPPAQRGPAQAEVIPVSDAPYDHRLWSGADDEGVGVRDRRCP